MLQAPGLFRLDESSDTADVRTTDDKNSVDTSPRVADDDRKERGPSHDSMALTRGFLPQAGLRPKKKRSLKLDEYSAPAVRQKSTQ